MKRKMAEAIAEASGGKVRETFTLGQYGAFWDFGPFRLSCYGGQILMRLDGSHPIDPEFAANLHERLTEIEAAIDAARLASTTS